MKTDIFIVIEPDIKYILKLNRSVLSHLKWAGNKKYIKNMLLNGMYRDNLGMAYSIFVNSVWAGYIHFYAENEYIWLNLLAIDKKFQGQGLGEKLVRHVEAEAKFFKVNEIKLWCLESCVSYYESLGYVRFELDKKWYGMKKVKKC